MERFIVSMKVKEQKTLSKFKIQYGEIYSMIRTCTADEFDEFKIQYGEIYRKVKQHSIVLMILFKIQYGEIYRTRQK